MKGFPCLQVRLLHQILCCRSIANEMYRGAIQIIHVRQCNGFELSSFILFAK
jgi:hypothetical protein